MKRFISCLLLLFLFTSFEATAYAQTSQSYDMDPQTTMEMRESINRHRSSTIEQAEIPPEDSDFSVDNRIRRLKSFYDLTVKYDPACEDALPITLYYLESVCALLGTDFFTKMQPAFDDFGVQDFYLKFHSTTDEEANNYYGYTEYTTEGELSVHIFTGASKEANYFVLIHELGHVLNFAMGDDNSALEALNGPYGEYTDNRQYVSRYARYNSHEDFAELFRSMMFSIGEPRTQGSLVDAKYALLYDQLCSYYSEESNVVRRAKLYLGL